MIKIQINKIKEQGVIKRKKEILVLMDNNYFDQLKDRLRKTIVKNKDKNSDKSKECLKIVNNLVTST